MSVLCVIPSRIGSTRLPRKPLLDIKGKPLIQRTLENALHCDSFDKVIVATDSDEIAEIVARCGGEFMMTASHHQTGTDRVAEVAEAFPEMDIVVNLQGDEPFLRPESLKSLVEPWLAGENPEMTTLASPINFDMHYTSPDFVKVITDIDHNALYFSRSPLPYFRQQGVTVPVYHHKGLYAFRRDFLLKYAKMPQTPLELAESLEQLRVLEHGYKIRVCYTDSVSLEINTPAELLQAQEFEF